MHRSTDRMRRRDRRGQDAQTELLACTRPMRTAVTSGGSRRDIDDRLSFSDFVDLKYNKVNVRFYQLKRLA